MNIVFIVTEVDPVTQHASTIVFESWADVNKYHPETKKKRMTRMNSFNRGQGTHKRIVTVTPASFMEINPDRV